MTSYSSPLVDRYASPEMLAIFSPDKRYTVWRQLWIELAKAEHTAGLPISEEMLQEMEKHKSTFHWDTIASYEKKLKHDVMAHVHAYGDLCPSAKRIIHLGATSCYVTDNADLILLKEAIALLLSKLKAVLSGWAEKAETLKTSLCLAYTHFQPAQPTTMGKRLCLWLQDLLWDAQALQATLQNLPFLGLKGTTGTQASFLTLLETEERVEAIDQQVAKAFGFHHILSITGQTYPRKLDTQILQVLSGLGASCHKLGTDIRLLSHTGEATEGFDKGQVGSSAMPYKKNPTRSERLCSIARLLMSSVNTALHTASTQWLERSLDDSAARRMLLPESFLLCDALINLLGHLASHFSFNSSMSEQKLQAHLPLLVTENILMKSVQRGGDRQVLHEKLKQLCHEASPLDFQTLKQAIGQDQAFAVTAEEIEQLAKPDALWGRSPQQVDTFLREELQPFLFSLEGPATSPPQTYI